VLDRTDIKTSSINILAQTPSQNKVVVNRQLLS
jgi:hypothetical protein